VFPQGSTTTTTIPVTPPNLPRTGSSPYSLLGLGVVLILTGLGLTVSRPRRART
jgi:LPXTG-motif cell wall-anchored protein